MIADTHGWVRPETLEALAGSDLIVHAGDVGKPGVLEALAALAPVFAVRGNVDRGERAAALPRTAVVEVGEVLLYVIHELQALDLDPAAAGFSAVISGHSHRPEIEERSGVLYLNPGSAGPRRFHLPTSIAWLHIRGHTLQAELLFLDENG